MYSDDQQSPFDVALSRPFLDEPTRKKWCVSKPSSWFSGSNNNSGTMSDYQDSDVESVSFGSEADHDYESHPLIPGASRARTGLRNPFDPIDDEIIMANGGASGPTSMRSKTVIHHPLTITDDDLEQARMSVTRNQEEVSVIKAIQQETLDIDLAIMMERQAELGEIAGSMRHLRDIQQDLALVVDSQGDDIKRLSWNSIEAFHHTESGLEHLVATVKHRQEQKLSLYSLCASAAVVMGVCYIVASFFSSDDIDAAMPSADAEGSPSFMMPSYLLP